MKTKKILTLITLATVLTLVGITGVKTIKAQEANGYHPIIQKLVDRFNLDPTQVEEVFNQEREERHTQMQSRWEERLNQKVADGSLTEAQKQAILDKKAKMQANFQNNQNLSIEERRDLKETHQAEMKTWAEENGIDMSQLFGFGEKGLKRGQFGPKMGW